MCKLLSKILSILFLCSFLIYCSNSTSYSNSNGQIVDSDGQIIVANIMDLTASDTDAAICGALQDPAGLPMVSYSDSRGFNTCVARCLTFTTRQICHQLPANSNVLATQPTVLQQMLSSCTQDIESFVMRGTQCHYVNCEP